MVRRADGLGKSPWQPVDSATSWSEGIMSLASIIIVSWALTFGILLPGARSISSPDGVMATAQAAAAQLPPGCPARPQSSFGTKERTAVSMEGKIYFIPEDSGELPDFSKLKSEGSIYASEWNVAPRDFEEGFPGVTNRFEWFALDYQGSLYVPKAGDYSFRLGSDDGSILYLDDKVVVNNDNVHAWEEKDGQVTLPQGDHKFRLSFFQGPASYLGLQLWVTPPGEHEKIFRLQDFNRGVVQNRSQLGVDESADEIRVKFGAEVLFDTGKFDLKPAATTSLTQLAELLRGYPGSPIVIEGHTDTVGTPAANQTLSENRAKAVKTWLVEKGQVPDGCIRTVGFGQTNPVASNDTADGRQRNRRVEVRLLKTAPEEPK
jgi:outer membrane protein OmpA-like peptidoglycan-associated protein